MDFTQNPNINQPVHHSAGVTPAGEHMKGANNKRKRSGVAWLRLGGAVLLFSVTILILALLTSIVLSQPKSESKYVEAKKYQAVFLNGGQVYFGRVTALNEKFLQLQDIYYLRVNQQVQPDGKQSTNNDVSLVKLGCELHGPQDEMVINREQVIFWENLKDDGQVAKAVATFKQQNPNGQKCETTTTTPSSTTPATKKP